MPAPLTMWWQNGRGRPDEQLSSENYEYIGSNPKGYVSWFQSKQRIRYNAIRTSIISNQKGIYTYGEIKPIKEYKIRTPLQKAIQILKRHRDTQGNHNHVILEDIDDKHVSVGTTTRAKKGKNSPNYKCENDIIGNGEQSYLRRQGIVDFKTNYSDPKQGRMTIKDYAQAKIYGQRAKEKYLAQKTKSND